MKSLSNQFFRCQVTKAIFGESNSISRNKENTISDFVFSPPFDSVTDKNDLQINQIYKKKEREREGGGREREREREMEREEKRGI
jgi:hypothetical protein